MFFVWPHLRSHESDGSDVNFSRFDVCIRCLSGCDANISASMSAFDAFWALMSTSLALMSACDALWALMPKQLMSTLLRCLLATMQDEAAPIALGLLLLDVVVILRDASGNLPWMVEDQKVVVESSRRCDDDT